MAIAQSGLEIDTAIVKVLAGIKDLELAARYPGRAHFISAAPARGRAPSPAARAWRGRGCCAPQRTRVELRDSAGLPLAT